jgi:Pentapeptide repeats (8 copies)
MGANSMSPQTVPGQGSSPNGSGKTLITWAQLAASLASVVGILIAVWVATQGQVTVDRSAQSTLQQSEDAQLSTAITAIGSDNTAEEVAGLLLLSRNTASRFTLMDDTKESPADVFDDYTTTLQILSGYLSSHSESYLAAMSPQISVTFGRGYGVPPPPGLPIDIVYAADQVKALAASGMASRVAALHAPTSPALDLSGDELIGQPWSGVNLGWIFADLTGIDLRGADLEQSQWSLRSHLHGADLQCADLQGANFKGADLNGADLSGAYVAGADFRGADLRGAVLTPVYGTAKWPRQTGVVALSGGSWSLGACLRNKSFWRQ